MGILVVFFSLCLLACAICAGFCVGAVMGSPDRGRLSLWQRKDGAVLGRKDRGASALSEDEERELRKRQREMQNFFNYNGDAMPLVEEE